MKILQNLMYFFLVSPVFADGGDEPKRIGEIFLPLDNIFKYVFPFAGLLCVIFIIIGGYMWMIAAGDPQRVKTAQNTLTWAIIGLIVVSLTAAVIQVITKFIG